MEYTILDKQANETFEEILRRIYLLQSGGTIDSLQAIGADTKRQLGASYVSLKNLAASYTPNEQIALLLWNQQKREEQILACFLLPVDLNKEKITQLIRDCISFEIAGYFGSLYLHKRSDLKDFAMAWLNSEIPFLQLATLTALSRYLILHKENGEITTEFYKSAINRNYKDKYVQLAAERYRFNI